MKVAVAGSPFEDLEGNGCQFGKQGKQKLSGRKLANATRDDLLNSLATLLREVAWLGPSIPVGTGQGGIVTLAAASPVVVEAVLLARNMHLQSPKDSQRMVKDHAVGRGEPSDFQGETWAAAPARSVPGVVFATSGMPAEALACGTVRSCQRGGRRIAFIYGSDQNWKPGGINVARLAGKRQQ